MKKYLLSVFTLVCASFMAWAAVNAAGDTTTFGTNGSYYTENSDGSYTLQINSASDMAAFTDAPYYYTIPWANANVVVKMSEDVSISELIDNDRIWMFNTKGIVDFSNLSSSQGNELGSITPNRFNQCGGIIVPPSHANDPETFWQGEAVNRYGISGTTFSAYIYSNGNALVADLVNGMDACTAVVVKGNTNDGLKDQTTLNDINNNLPLSVTSVTITGKISDSQSTVSITNPNITSLSFAGATNVVNISLDGLVNLETLDLNDVTFNQNQQQRSITFTNVNENVVIYVPEEFDVSILPTDYQDNVAAPVEPDPVEVTVAGSSLQDNLATVLASMEGNPKPKNVVRIHVTGTVTADDLHYIRDNMPNLLLCDLSEATVTAATVISELGPCKMNGNTLKKSGNELVVFPKSERLTAAQLYALQQNWVSFYAQGHNYAYYTSDTELHSYIFQGTSADNAAANVESLKELAYFYKNGAKSLIFDAAYNQDGTFTYKNQTTQNYAHYANVFASLHEVPCENLDLSWENISEVGTDFTALNDATYYLIIPQNATTEAQIATIDFTNETQGHYTYNSNLKVVATYKGKEAPYGMGAVFGGQFRNFSTSKFNQTANVTYVRQAGALSGAEDYVSDLQKSADKMIILGELNSNDLEVMDFIESEYVDLSQATMAEGSSINEYDNDYVKYLALPYNCSQETIETLVGECSNLLAIATYEQDTKTLIAHLNESHNLYKATHMIEDIYDSKSGGGHADNVENLVLTGNISAIDITNGVTQAGHYDSEGGTNITSTQITDDDRTLSQVAGRTDLIYPLDRAPIKSIDISDAVFEDNGELAIVNCYGETLEHIDLPTAESMTTIPTGTFDGCVVLDDLCIPYNYEKFESYAFNNNYELDHIFTTNADGDVIDNGAHTYTLSANVKEIESHAFLINLHDDDSAGGHLLDNYISDVYVLATTAPICKKDAFDGKFTWGNNTFQGQWDHPVSRDIYYYRGQYIAVLHWPENVDATNLDRYTDTHRDYTLVDETAATNGDGQVLTWPNHGEFGQSFTSAQDSKYWDGEAWAEADNYCGWHEFVLSNSSRFVEDELVPDIWDFSQYKDDDWWTICVPFDMTGKQIAEVFGDQTKVHKLCNVDRSWVVNDGTIDYKNGKITFNFGSSLFTDATSENVVMEANYSYLIKPSHAKGGAQNNNGVMAGFRANLGDNPDEYLPKAYDVTYSSKNGLNDQHKHVYSFYGNYNLGAKRPQYSYFLGLVEGKAAWKRDMAGNGKWNRYTAVIMDNVERTVSVNDATEGGVNGAGFDNSTVDFVAVNDDFNNVDLEDAGQLGGGSINTSMLMEFGEASETDAIYTIDGKDYVNARFMGNVYNLRGEKVASDAEGILHLPKGIYVANGKKFIVK